ncbi:MAG: hypothetical protein ABFE13_13610 [Phycisphaerales bacterium]
MAMAVDGSKAVAESTMRAFTARFALVILPVFTAGCAGYKPVIAKPGYLGVGAFREHRHADVTAPEYIDVDGVGCLFLADRVVLGYARLACVFCGRTQADFRICLSRAEVAVGDAAVAMAREMAQEAVQRQTKGDNQ